MAELDGTWDVRRVAGALPPLTGVRKRIRGASGETIVVGGRGIPFDVRENELRYRAPFAFLVDILEPRGDGFHGRATAFGRTYGEFELRRARVTDIQTQLVNHIDEAHALEQTVLRMLDGLIQGADEPQIIDRLEHVDEERERRPVAQPVALDIERDSASADDDRLAGRAVDPLADAAQRRQCAGHAPHVPGSVELSHQR